MNDSQTPASAITLTTVNVIANRDVETEIEIVTGEFVVFVNAWQDVGADRREAMALLLKQGRNAALQDLRREAFAVGADAVVGIVLTSTLPSYQGQTMLIAVATGTAVLLAPQSGSA